MYILSLIFSNKQKGRHIVSLFVAILFVLSGASSPLWAQISFKTEAPNTVSLSEKIRIRFILNSAPGDSFKDPEVEGVSTLYPPSKAITQTEHQGKPSTIYTGTYLAQQAGTIRIGSAEVKVKGKVYKTAPLSIKVLPAEKGAKKSNSSAASNIFIKAIPSKNKAFLQEGILVSYKIYTQSTRVKFEQSKFPEYDGFIEEEINNDHNIQLSMERYNGKNYYTGIIRQSIIMPQRSGTLTIPQGEINLTVEMEKTYQNSDELLETTNLPTVQQKVKTDEIKINVSELPRPRPEGFDGAVGSFAMKAEMPSKNIKTDEPFTIKLTISGRGNLKFIPIPSLNLPESFEVLGQDDQSEIKGTLDGIKGKRVIEYQVVAHNTGNYELPALRLVYFSPERTEYATTQTSPLPFVVSKGMAGTYEEQKNNTTRLSANDIAPLHTQSLYNKSLTRFLYSPLYWGLYLLMLSVTIGSAWLYRKRRKAVEDVIDTKYKKAAKELFKKLNELQTEERKKGNEEAFYEQVLSSVYSYLSDKFHLSTSVLNISSIRKTLEQAGCVQTDIEELLQIVQQAEFERYAPNSDRTTQQSLVERTINVVQKIELSKKKGS